MTTPLNPNIPAGFCQCGCGQKTTLHKRGRTIGACVKGSPCRYVAGHGHKREHLGPSQYSLEKRRRFADAKPFKIDGGYCKLIPLTKGMYAIVDAADFPWLSEYTWRACWNQGVGSFYAYNRELGSMHRVILGLTRDDLLTGDHIDPSQTCDNRRKNLRPADASQQQYNTRRRKDNTSGYKGVSWDKQRGKYVTQIKTNGKGKRIFWSHNPRECADAYRVAAEAQRKEFARIA